MFPRKTHPNTLRPQHFSPAEVLKAQVRQRVRQDAAVAVIGDGVEESHHPEEVHQQDPGVGHLVECHLGWIHETKHDINYDGKTTGK